jgi:pimeloyl-ACP methyl ester carboxylesterase
MKQALLLSFIVILLAVIIKINLAPSIIPKPPVQPASGPGGGDYRYQHIRVSSHGKGVHQYWLFEPADAREALPVIVFNHGWMAVYPTVYGGWIGHLVRKGNIVIYPRYQKDAGTSPRAISNHAIKAVKAALIELQRPKHAKPDLNRFAIVGHSMGGTISANMAARAASEHLPEVKVLMSVQPGKTWQKSRGANALIALDDLSAISSEILMLVVVSDQDSNVFDKDGKRIFHEAVNVKKENKNLIYVHSDQRGEPPLLADHGSPSSRCKPWRRGDIHMKCKGVNALDYYAYWKLFDALRDAAFEGKNRDIALGNTESQRYMGEWSDGEPVKPLTVITAE